MGTCRHCNKEISLKDNEKNCPGCGLAPYKCWNCHESITGETKECVVCNFFICPDCGVCGKDCKIHPLIKEVKGMPLRRAVEHIYASIKAPDRRCCPNGVPISYGHGKLKNMALRLKAISTRNKEDSDAFVSRFENIKLFSVGHTWTISQQKQDGQYGIELREVSNLSVCMGQAKKTKMIERDDDGNVKREYELFRRVDGVPCIHRNWNSLVSMYCSKCDNTFPMEQTHCGVCAYSRGKRKGQAFELTPRRSKVHFCQLRRQDYKKKKKEGKDGHHSGLIR